MEQASWVAAELEGVVLPDRRYRANLIQITERLAAQPGASFSAACGERLRQSACRLLGSGELDLLSTHRQCSCRRCAEAGGDVILVVEDTTDIVYPHRSKTGLGILGGVGPRLSRGLNAHSALALRTDGQALGIVHQRIWAPKADHAGLHREAIPIGQKESLKWLETLREVNKGLAAAGRSVFVIADREADFFEHYSEPRAAGVELLVRVQQKKRKVLYDGRLQPVSEVLTAAPALGHGQVKVWRRKDQRERLATVAYSAAEVVLPPTRGQHGTALPMRLLYVKEQSAGAEGAGVEAIEWVLLTSAAVGGLDDIVTYASYYARRWVVERFHLILKSGLGIERLQMEDATRLTAALQLYSLVAWHVLALHRLAHSSASDDAATAYIDEQTVEIVATATRTTVATVRDFCVALGKLGGFRPTKKQPLPGERTLWTGLRTLQAVTLGFQTAKEKYATG